MTNPAYSDPQYKRLRAQLLKDNPVCQWCGINPASQADHLVELDAGGDHSESNLVASCGKCNSARGARYVNNKTRQRIADRNEAMKKNGTIDEPIRFFESPPLTPSKPLSSISETGRNWPELAGTGRARPRLETPLPDHAGSYGPLVGEWSKTHLGVELMPWQETALYGQLIYDESGDFLNRTSLVSVARQNGKTTALMALAGWILTDWVQISGRKQTLLSTAHRLDLACQLFDELAPVLVEKFGAKATWSYGRNQIVMPDRSKWLVRAANGSVGHGLSCTAVIADEIWNINEESIMQGLSPSMRAQRSPLMSLWSTAGTEESSLFLKFREQGLRAIDAGTSPGFYMAEWSPPPELNPLNPEAWLWGNPAVGFHGLTLETIAAESQTPDRAAFLRASVNLWVSSDKSWLPHDLWPALAHTGEMPTGGIVAVENSFDESRYFGLRAVALPDRRIVVEVAFVVDTIAKCWEEIHRIAKDTTVRFALTPSIDLHTPATFERRRVIVGYGELLKYTGGVRALINEKMVRHNGNSAMLSEHVMRAVAVKSQAGLALSSQRSPGPIELARCLVWAVALSSRPGNNGVKPFLVVAN